LDDFGLLIQNIIAFIGGLGLTGIAVTIYEARVRRKERAVDRFCELVLTPVLFRCMSVTFDIINLYGVYGKIRKGESVSIYVDGVLVDVADYEDLRRRMDVLREEHAALSRKLDDTGVASLAPESMRNGLSEVNRALNEMRRRADAGEDLSGIVKQTRGQLRQVSVGIRKIVGTYGLVE
jgi:hypothetical protein